MIYIPYCFRPTDISNTVESIFIDGHGYMTSFEEMYSQNVTALQLLYWSIPVDITARYQLYLHTPHIELNEKFYNCTEPWFGDLCQYSFGSDQGMSMNEIIEAQFHSRIPYDTSEDMMIQLPCYVLLQCDRGGSHICLDWREICDGMVDCLDGGHDEEFCFEMEINECEIDEYRCHNGLCISGDLWENGMGNADCLDRSDELYGGEYMEQCYQDPSFRCEEHACKANLFTFSCGDGQCVKKFDACHNGRHMMLRQSMAMQGNLSEKCWISMVCLTGLLDKVNGSSCATLFAENRPNEYREECDVIYQFPIIPIYSNHVRFVYNRTHEMTQTMTFLLPDYICYDRQLCDFIPVSFISRWKYIVSTFG